MKRFGLKNPNKRGQGLRPRRGFTLIEVLIVIVIFAILFAVIFIVVRGIQMKSRNTKRESDMDQVHKALQIYQNDVGEYPSGDYGALSDLAPDYIGQLPKDPLDSDCHKYTYVSTDGTTYTLKYCKEPGCADCPELKP